MERAARIHLWLGTVLFALLGSTSLRAQIVAPSGRTLFNKNVMVRCLTRVDFFNEPAPGLNVRSFAVPCMFVWGFHRDTNLIVVAPFAVLDVDQRAGGEVSEKTSAGFGDGLIQVQYDGFYKKNVPKGFTRVGGQFGVKVPTGRSGFTSDSVDYLFTVIFSRVRDRNWLIADSQFTLTTENGSGIKPGSRWNYDLAYLYRLSPLEGKNLFLVLEANGEMVGRTRVQNHRLADSGGNLFFLSPGVEFLPTRRLVMEFSVPIPFVKDLNGRQLEPKLSLIAGIRFLF
ncbi:MAG: hypothetical protein HYS33_03260 [Acidobacteria bacterium]|nr:hypothetical protein [Acidobacteriota bacterium]